MIFGRTISFYLYLSTMAAFILSATLPPMAAPDEPAHLFKAEALAEGHLVGKPIGEKRGNGIDAGVIRLFLNVDDVTSVAPATPEVRRRLRETAWVGQLGDAVFSNTAQYGPIFYLPQALALKAGRLSGLSVLAAYEVARTIAALTAIALGAIALTLVTRGRLLFLIVLLLPMSLFLLASIGQEGILIAVSALCAATASRIRSNDESTGHSVVWLGLACAIGLAMARPPLALLSLLLVSPKTVTTTWRRWCLSPRGALAPLVVATMTAGWLALSGSVGARISTDPAVDQHAQLISLLADPLRVVPIAVATVSNDFLNLAMQAVGVLGWLKITLPGWAYDWGWASLGLATLSLVVEPGGPSLKRAAIVWCVIGMTAGTLSLATYLSWTPVGGSQVEGLQGRYFIPLFFLIPLAIPSLSIPANWARFLRIPFTAVSLIFVSAITVRMLTDIHGIFAWGSG